MSQKPTQPAKYFAGLSTGRSFTRSFESQDNIPIDGSNDKLRSFSPFVIRALAPLILGGEAESDTLRAHRAPTSPTPDGVVTSNDNSAAYSAALLNAHGNISRSAEDFQSLLALGEAIPGITSASLREINAEAVNVSVTEAATSRLARDSPRTRVIPAHANNVTALSILQQLKALTSVPPLILLINPTSFTVSYAKIAQFQEQSRHGYIYQAWGEELTKLSISCTVGAFISGKQNPSQSDVTSGMQFASKRDSASFQQLMAMMTFFQSSAYLTDTVHGTRAHLMIGNLSIEYDQNVYVGHMDSFSYSFDEAEQNGGMKFEIDFTAIKVFDLARPKSALSALRNPGSATDPGAGTHTVGSRLSRTFLSGNQSQRQVFTAPTIGTSGNTPAQPWSGRTVSLPAESTAPLITRRVVTGS